MNEVYYELESRSERLPRQAAKSAQTYKWLIRSAVVLLWLLLAVGAFLLASHYVGCIRNQLIQIQQTNQANMAEMNKKLSELQTALQANMELAEVLKQQFILVESELKAVQEEMTLAGDSLSTNAKSKQALSERITDLSKELEELRKSIKKLEEAARVY